MGSKYEFGTNAEAPGHAASRRKHTAASRTPVAGPKPNTNSTTRNDRSAKAHRLGYQARIWINENHDAWAFMVSRALAETKAGRKFGMNQFIEETRRKDFVDVHGDRTRISNTLSPAFARMLITDHPECRRFMEIKHSMLDEVRP